MQAAAEEVAGSKNRSLFEMFDKELMKRYLEDPVVERFHEGLGKSRIRYLEILKLSDDTEEAIKKLGISKELCTIFNNGFWPKYLQFLNALPAAFSIPLKKNMAPLSKTMLKKGSLSCRRT